MDLLNRALTGFMAARWKLSMVGSHNDVIISLITEHALDKPSKNTHFHLILWKGNAAQQAAGGLKGAGTVRASPPLVLGLVTAEDQAS